MTEELKPCPFCGGEATIYNGDSRGHSVYVMCKRCQCSTSLETRKHAIEDWNRRVKE